MATTIVSIAVIVICFICSVALEWYQDWYLKERKNGNKKSD